MNKKPIESWHKCVISLKNKSFSIYKKDRKIFLRSVVVIVVIVVVIIIVIASLHEVYQR